MGLDVPKYMGYSYSYPSYTLPLLTTREAPRGPQATRISKLALGDRLQLWTAFLTSQPVNSPILHRGVNMFCVFSRCLRSPSGELFRLQRWGYLVAEFISPQKYTLSVL